MELGLWIVCWKRKVEMKGFAECVIHDRVLCTKGWILSILPPSSFPSICSHSVVLLISVYLHSASILVKTSSTPPKLNKIVILASYYHQGNKKLVILLVQIFWNPLNRHGEFLWKEEGKHRRRSWYPYPLKGKPLTTDSIIELNMQSKRLNAEAKKLERDAKNLSKRIYYVMLVYSCEA